MFATARGEHHMASAVADADPVLYYEHITLYRDPRIKQTLSKDAPAPIPIGQAALRRAGDAVAMITYGAYVHGAFDPFAAFDHFLAGAAASAFSAAS